MPHLSPLSWLILPLTSWSFLMMFLTLITYKAIATWPGSSHEAPVLKKNLSHNTSFLKSLLVD